MQKLQLLFAHATLLGLLLITAAGAREAPTLIKDIESAATNEAPIYNVATLYRGLALTDVVPYHIAVDPATPGHLFASDTKASAIYFMDFNSPGSSWQLKAGTPHVSGWSDGPGPQARLSNPKGLCVGPKGHVFFLDHGVDSPYVILRRVDAETGEVTTIAGNMNKTGFEDGAGSAAVFSTGSSELSCLADGQVLVNEMGGHGAIRRVSCSGEACVTAPPQPGPHSSASVFAWLATHILAAALGGAVTAAVMQYYTVIFVKVQQAVLKYRQGQWFVGLGGGDAPLLLEGGAAADVDQTHLDSHALCASLPATVSATVSVLCDVAHDEPAAASSEPKASAPAEDLLSLDGTDGSYVNLIDLGEEEAEAAASAAATSTSAAAASHGKAGDGSQGVEGAGAGEGGSLL